jgi:DNA polymerase-3 subunit gamma/tau
MLSSTINFIFDRDTASLIGIVKQVDDSGCNMRHFCHELIDIMRALLLIKTVPSAADLLDLSERELEEGRTIAAKAGLQTIQRCISILLKTDADMAHSSFARLLLETAMIRMATLVPTVPVNELLERLKALEAAPARPVLAAEPASPRYTADAKPAPAVTAPSPADPPLKTVQPVAVSAGVPDWQGFVAFVKAKKPMLGAKLEKGSPIKTSGADLQIGYARGSLELSLLKEADYRQELALLSASYFGQPADIKIIPLTADDAGIPLSISEKKNLDAAMKEKAVKDAADGHPFVKAALEVFGGEIVAYKS